MTVMVNENVLDIQQVYLLRKSIIIKSIFVFFLPISDNNHLKKEAEYADKKSCFLLTCDREVNSY